MDVRHLTDDDVVEAVGVFVASLGDGPPKQPELFQRYWDVPSSLGCFGDDGRVLGVAARFATQLTAVGGAPLSCTAVPSVGVRPDAQRRGAGRALLERQVVEAVEHGDQVMALNASEVQIYGRYGYGPISSWWSVEADPRRLRWRDDAPRAVPGSIEEVDDETAHELLPDLHARAFGGWAGELARPDDWWFMSLHPRPERPRPLLCAVHRREDGTVDAAARYTIRHKFDDVGFANEVELRDLFGLDPAAEALLLRWLLERRLVGRFTAERCNPRTPVEWMLEDGRQLRTTAAADATWVRVLDVPAVVAARTTMSEGAVDVAVRDQLVTGNHRTWRIAGEGGRLTCEPSDAAPAVVVHAHLLAPLLWGYAEPTRLAAAGRLTVEDRGGLDVLQRLLATAEPAWCSTPF